MTPAGAKEVRLTPAKIRRMILLALDGAQPGTMIEVEADGIRVRVKRDAPAESVTVSSDDDALNRVRQRLEASGLV